MPKLSPRLEAILSLLEPCRYLADIGTDHGLVPVTAVKRGIAAAAIATDIRSAPLAAAEARIIREELGDKIETRLGDGLLALSGAAPDSVVIAGMSGQRMVAFLSAAPQSLRAAKQLVLQPNRGADHVRRWARARNWHLRSEAMLCEGKWFFVFCDFVRGEGLDPAYPLPSAEDELRLRVGPHLANRKDPVAHRYCEVQRAQYQRLVRLGAAHHSSSLRLFESACALLKPEGPL
jgi:tRNA (adenine22-N1)-methyltransferase